VVEYDASKEEFRSIDDLKVQLGHRKVWMASSIHRREEEGYCLLFHHRCIL